MLGAKLGILDKQYNIVTDGLILDYEPSFQKSYPGSGTNIYNLASGSLTPLGSFTSGTTATGSIGSNGGYMRFDGTDDCVDCGSVLGTFNAGDPFSLNFWFYLTDDDPLTIHRAIIGRSSTTVGWVARIHDAIGGVPRLSFCTNKRPCSL